MAKSGSGQQRQGGLCVDQSGSAALAPLVTNPGQMRREASKRRRPYEKISVKEELVADYEADGWEVDRQLKTKTRLKRYVGADARLENRFWYLLYRMGYPEMSHGRSFTIAIERKGAEPLRKQIDVFAKDDETVVVAECKAAKRVGKRSLQKDIEEFANLKGPIAKSIKKHYGYGFKPKIIWLFVTENIVWSGPDKERAAGESIRIVTERELRYYLQIAEHLGPAARYQFLAEFLKDQRIPELKDVIVPAIRGKLGGKNFYSFITTPRQLLKISFVNHRSLNDPDGAPTYQRLVNRTRMKQVGRFLQNGGFFPTNLLVNFTRSVRFDIIKKDEIADVAYGQLFFPDRYQSAWIIDGQHRLYGFAHLDPKYLDHNIIVVAFQKLSKEEEANLFVTINHEQKTVPKNLLDDLEGELKWGSDVPSQRIGAIGSRLISVLNADIGEPFYARVAQQGIPPTDAMCLTVPSLKEGLRRSGLLGRAVLKRKVYEPGPLSSSTDANTLDRARSGLNSFFSAFRDTNPRQWEKGRAGFLCTNVAIQAYLMLLKAMIDYMEANKGMDAKELTPQELIMELEEYAEPILKFLSKATDSQMEKNFKVQFGSGGPPEYYYRLCCIVKGTFGDFEPEGLADWESEQSEEKIQDADRKLKQLNIKVHSYIFRVLKDVYGQENDAYWHKGVTDKQMKTRAYETSLDDEDRLPLENYLNFIDYKKIVEKKDNWALFRDVLDIPELGEKGHSKNLQWMERVNELRRLPAHATEMRRYKVEDFDYIDWIFDEFIERLENVSPNDTGTSDA